MLFYLPSVWIIKSGNQLSQLSGSCYSATVETGENRLRLSSAKWTLDTNYDLDKGVFDCAVKNRLGCSPLASSPDRCFNQLTNQHVWQPALSPAHFKWPIWEPGDEASSPRYHVSCYHWSREFSIRQSYYEYLYQTDHILTPVMNFNIVGWQDQLTSSQVMHREVASNAVEAMSSWLGWKNLAKHTFRVATAYSKIFRILRSAPTTVKSGQVFPMYLATYLSSATI